MQCPSCRHIVPTGARFCSQCSEPLAGLGPASSEPLRCPSCKHYPLPAGARFCSECSMPLDGSQPETAGPTAERSSGLGFLTSLFRRRGPRWSYSERWEAKCPKCGTPFGPATKKCPIDGAALFVRTIMVNLEKLSYSQQLRFPFTYGLWIQQEIRCSNDDGFFDKELFCPSCKYPVGESHLHGIHEFPRRMVFLPMYAFSVLLFLGGTYFIGIIFLGWFSVLLSHIYVAMFIWLPTPLRKLFMADYKLSFYETNEHEAINLEKANPKRGYERRF